MTELRRLSQSLEQHEAKSAFVYDDATGKPIGPGTVVKGYPTIGIGRNLLSNGLADDEIRYLLNNDIASALKDAQTFPWFAGLDNVRQNVIVELCFNLGLVRFRTFKKFIEAMATNRFNVAAAELADSKWQQQVDPILGDGKGRADVLINMIRTGEWPA